MNLYENKIFSELQEGIRPGGLELTEYLMASCGFKEGACIADIGCGTGISLDFISRRCGFDTIGIDLSSVLLKKAHERSTVLHLVQAAGEHLPFRDCSIDGVLCECSLSVMDDPDIFIHEINRVLAENGKLAVSDIYFRQPEHAALMRGIPAGGCLTGALTYDEIYQKLTDSGFRIILWEDHSDIWKAFIAKLIMEYGSLCKVLSCSLSGDNCASLLPAAAQRARPGYYCMIAEKHSCI